MSSNRLTVILLAILALRALGIGPADVVAGFVCAAVCDCAFHGKSRIHSDPPPNRSSDDSIARELRPAAASGAQPELRGAREAHADS